MRAPVSLAQLVRVSCLFLVACLVGSAAVAGGAHKGGAHHGWYQKPGWDREDKWAPIDALVAHFGSDWVPLPLDESAQCYKSSAEVISAVVAAGLARVVHTLWPLASIKGNEERAAKDRQRERKGRDRSREKDRDAERAAARKTKGHF